MLQYPIGHVVNGCNVVFVQGGENIAHCFFDEVLVYFWFSHVYLFLYSSSSSSTKAPLVKWRLQDFLIRSAWLKISLMCARLFECILALNIWHHFSFLNHQPQGIGSQKIATVILQHSA